MSDNDNDEEFAVATQLQIKESPEEYHRRIMEFAAKQTEAFVVAGAKSSIRQEADKHLKEAAEATGLPVEILAGMRTVDGKFSALAASGVLVNVLRLVPERLRGLLLQECLDFLVLNTGISQASAKAVLQNSLMNIGSPAESITIGPLNMIDTEEVKQ